MKTNLSPELNEFLNLEEVKTFLDSANSFVQLLEDNEISKERFVKEAHLALVDLYSKGIKLPEVELKYSGETEFDREKLFESKNKGKINELGQETFYWEILDPTYAEDEKEPVQGWLSDDFSDIYRDLKIEINKLKQGTNESVEDALWSLKWGFDNHWGNHCIDAMRAMHYLWYDEKKTNLPNKV